MLRLVCGALLVLTATASGAVPVAVNVGVDAGVQPYSLPPLSCDEPAPPPLVASSPAEPQPATASAPDAVVGDAPLVDAPLSDAPLVVPAFTRVELRAPINSCRIKLYAGVKQFIETWGNAPGLQVRAYAQPPALVFINDAEVRQEVVEFDYEATAQDVLRAARERGFLLPVQRVAPSRAEAEDAEALAAGDNDALGVHA